MEKAEFNMLIEKISELKEDNTKEHDEIKEGIRCLPCKEHSNRLATLETINSEANRKGANSSDDVVTKRVMYIFTGIIAGIVLLIREIPAIIKSIISLSGQ